MHREDFLYLRILILGAVGMLALAPDQARALELSLPSALALALSENQSLLVSKMTLEGDRFLIDAANADFQLKLIPVLSLGKVGTRSPLNDPGASTVSYGLQLGKKFDLGTQLTFGPAYYRSAGTNDTRLNVLLSQPLLKGFGAEANLDGVRRAEYSVTSSGLNFRQAQIDTALATITAFYQAIRQRETVANHRALTDKLRQHVLLAERKEKAALAGPMDTYRAVIRLRDAEAALALAESAFSASIDTLRLLLNLPPERSLELTAAPDPGLKIENPELEALDRDIELKQLRAELEEASRSVRVADNATLPEISLQLGYGTAFGGIPSTLPPQQWSIAVQSTSDLFRSAARSDYRRAEVRSATLEVNLHHRADDLRRRVRQQLSEISSAEAQIAVREEQIKEARGKLALAEVKFTNDMADNFDVIESETELQRAELGLLETRTNHALGIYNLKALTGHLL